MEIGTKLICIKNFLNFNINNFYTISNMEPYEHDNSINFIKVNNTWFSDSNFEKYNFNEYFLTEFGWRKKIIKEILE